MVHKGFASKLTFELTDEEGTYLVKLARETIVEYLKTCKKKRPLRIIDKLKTKCGVFTTLSKIENDATVLRGCIGYPETTLPLYENIIDSSINAATADPRFPPVTLDEMNNIIVEVSILTPLQLIKVKNPKEYPKEVRIGIDGLVIECGWNRGLLLPQVPIEWEWNNEEFLSNCCLKAGTTPDQWLLPNVKIYRFQAIIFKEERPNERVKRISLI